MLSAFATITNICSNISSSELIYIAYSLRCTNAESLLEKREREEKRGRKIIFLEKKEVKKTLKSKREKTSKKRINQNCITLVT